MKKAKPKPPAFSVEFGKRMKATRILAGYSTVREGADALQLDEGRYGRWERGERDPDVNSEIIYLCDPLTKGHISAYN